MVGRAAPTATHPSDGRGYRPGHRARPSQSNVLAATDRLAPARSAKRPAARPRSRPTAEIVFGGEVSSCPPRRRFASPSLPARRIYRECLSLTQCPLLARKRRAATSAIRCGTTTTLSTQSMLLLGTDGLLMVVSQG